MKRFISVLVVLCCLIGLCPVQVLAATDKNPPVVTGAYLSAPGAEVKAGDTLNLSVMVTDDSSLYFASGTAYLVNPDGSYDWNYSVYFIEYANEDTYDSSVGEFKVDVYVGSDVIDGTYRIENLTVRDKYGNETRLDVDEPGNIDFTTLWFSVAGNSTDKNPPVVTDAYLTEPGVELVAGERTELTVMVTDESSLYFASGTAYLVNPDGSFDWNYSVYFIKYANEDTYDSSTGKFKVDVYVGSDVIDGTYRIDNLTVRDKYGNETRLDVDEPGTIDFTNLWFSVTGNSTDKNPPVVTDAYLTEPGAELVAGERTELTVLVTDESSLYFTSGTAYLVNPDGSFDWNYSIYFIKYANEDTYDRSTGEFKADVYVGSDVIDGMIWVTKADSTSGSGTRLGGSRACPGGRQDTPRKPLGSHQGMSRGRETRACM